jgi:hypothetical protein
MRLQTLYTLDMDMALDTIVPETLEWRHTDEGQEYVVAVSRERLPILTIVCVCLQ